MDFQQILFEHVREISAIVEAVQIAAQIVLIQSHPSNSRNALVLLFLVILCRVKIIDCNYIFHLYI